MKKKREAEYPEKLNWIFNCRISEDFAISHIYYELLKGSDSQMSFTFIYIASQRERLPEQAYCGNFFLVREARRFQQ